MNRPALTCEQMRLFDQLAVEQLGIPSLLLMENAGAGAAHLLVDAVEQEQQLMPEQVRAMLVCGGGNNGGDGYTMARHLHNYGVKVDILVASPLNRLSGDAATQAQICQRIGLNMFEAVKGELDDAAREACQHATVVVDCLLGTGFKGPVRDTTAALIHTLNQISGPMKVAIDLPSGLNGDTGEPDQATFVADMTITFVAAKRGLLAPEAEAFVNELAIVDIGAPLWLLRDILQPT